MLAALRIIFKLAMFLGGGLLVYTVITMYPGEEGTIQNRIENLWIAIDDKQKSAVGKATTLFNRLGSYITRIYNRILGVRLISIQMVGVSSASSLAGLCFVFVFAFFAILYLSLSGRVTTIPHINASFLLFGIVSLGLFFLLLTFAALPSLIRNWFGRALSLLPFLLLTYAMGMTVIRHKATLGELTILALLIVGIASDILVLAIVRLSVRLISTSARLRDIIFAMIVQVGALLLLTVVPFELSTPLFAANKDSPLAMFLLGSIMFNLFTVLGVVGFLALLSVVMLHRVFWPLLGRVVYSIARFKPLQNNRKTFAVVGSMCVLYGVGFRSWHYLLVWFIKRVVP